VVVRRQNLGDMLVAANLIDEVQMQIALAEQKQTGKRFGSTLVDLQFIDENVLAAFLSKQIDVPCISLLHIDIPKKVQRKFARDLAVNCQAIPVRVDDQGRLEVAMVDPTDVEILGKIEDAISMTVTPLIAPESSIVHMIEKFYPEDAGDDDTMAVRHKAEGGKESVATDPIFWDIIEELDSADLDRRLARIEQNLDRLWILLEKVLRTLETTERR
jgi:Type II secretion system (T2SS), protein E, N-terminal domain